MVLTLFALKSFLIAGGGFLDAFVALFLGEFGEDLVILGMLSFVTVFCMFFCSDYF